MYIESYLSYRKLQLLSTDAIQQFNDHYYKSIDYPNEASSIDQNSVQYPRHPINTQTRTGQNDVFLQIYFKTEKDHVFSPSFEQKYELEFFTGSKKGKVKYPILDEYSSFDITIVSQTTFFLSFSFLFLVQIVYPLSLSLLNAGKGIYHLLSLF